MFLMTKLASRHAFTPPLIVSRAPRTSIWTFRNLSLNPCRTSSPFSTTTIVKSTSTSPAVTTKKDSLDATLRIALKGYMKSRSTFESTVVKSILADLQTTSHLASPPNPHKVLLKSIKTRQEAATQFEQATPPRKDLAEQYLKEVSVLQQFVVPDVKSGDVEGSMNGEELSTLIKEVIESEGGNVGQKEMGKVIKLVLAKVEGKANGKQVSEAVKKYFM